MATVLRKFTKRTLVILNIVVALFYLLACLSPYLNPSTFWFMGFLGVGFPILFVLVAGFLVFWLILRKKLVYISLLAIVLSIKSISNVFAFHFNEKEWSAKEDGALRIMTWNIRRFIPVGKEHLEEVKEINRYKEIIAQYNPDVLCLQEYFTGLNVNYPDNEKTLRDMGYRYSSFSRDYTWWFGNGTVVSGPVIFSKYPIIDSGRITFATSGYSSESLVYATVKKGADSIKVICTHLQSFTFTAKDYRNIEKIKNQEDSALDATRGIIRKMKIAFKLRGEQVDEIKKFADASAVPEIIAGDFNDVPNSYAYHSLCNNRDDAFLKTGFGFGRTYPGFFPTLRIDFFLADPRFEILQFKRIEKKLSDHYPLVMDIKVKK